MLSGFCKIFSRQLVSCRRVPLSPIVYSRSLCGRSEIDTSEDSAQDGNRGEGSHAQLPVFSPLPTLLPILPVNPVGKAQYGPHSQHMSAPFITDADREKDGIRFTLNDDGVLVCQLSRSEDDRRLTWEMYQLLTKALRQANGSHQVSGVLLTGSGDIFCGGNSAVSLEDNGGMEGVANTSCKLLQALVAAVLDLNKPIVAAINGDCLGVAFKLLFLLDRVVAVETATFFHGGGTAGKHPLCCLSNTDWKEKVMPLGRITTSKAKLLGIVDQVARKDSLIEVAVRELRQLDGRADHRCDVERLHKINEAEISHLHSELHAKIKKFKVD